MMTVRELINELENYNDDTPVIIGEQQSYGSDWAYRISEISDLTYEDFDYDEEIDCVVLKMGRQTGTVNF